MKLDILGVAEARLLDTGYIKRYQNTLIHSGGKKHERGVGMLVKKEIEKYVSGYWTHNDRLILLKMRAQPFDISILQTYAPTKDYSEEEIEEYYEELQYTLKPVVKVKGE